MMCINNFIYICTFFAGLIRDATGSYVTVFHSMGTMMIIGGLWVLTVPLAVKFEIRKRQKKELQLDGLSYEI